MGSPAAPSPRPPRWLLPLGWAVAAALAGLHAAAWWGGAKLVALLAAGRGDAPAGGTPGRPGRWILALLAVAAVPAAILLLGSRVFLLADPFVADLRHFVA